MVREAKFRGAHLSNVTRRRETETTDKTSTHVGQDVTVQVWHDHDAVSIWLGVLYDLMKGGSSVSIPQVISAATVN